MPQHTYTCSLCHRKVDRLVKDRDKDIVFPCAKETEVVEVVEAQDQQILDEKVVGKRTCPGTMRREECPAHGLTPVAWGKWN